MRVLSLNLHFYPDSLGGATVVAEKLAWGLLGAGHQVTNVSLSHRSVPQDFTVRPTPFGLSVAINNIFPNPATRFSNPAAASILSEIATAVAPDLIIVHAPQHLGIFEFLRERRWLERTIIVAHDFFWVCLQGFRTLPDGGGCNLHPGPRECRRCAWHPGLTGTILQEARQILDGCRAVVFPSQLLREGYEAALGRSLANGVAQSNPDRAEMILPPDVALPQLPGAADASALKLGYFGGPGETKGWGAVQKIIAAASRSTASPARVFLFDAGRMLARPWYDAPPGCAASIADPFHWSYGAAVMGALDVVLMPSRVRESFGMAAREALSVGARCLIRPAGALADLAGCRDVLVLDEDADGAAILDQLADGQARAADTRPPWENTSIAAYTAAILDIATTARPGRGWIADGPRRSPQRPAAELAVLAGPRAARNMPAVAGRRA